MSPKSKHHLVLGAAIPLGVLLLSMVGSLGTGFAPAPEPIVPGGPPVVAEKRQPLDAVPLSPQETADRRDVGSPPAPVIERPPDPYAFEIDLLVRDELDLPLEGAEVYLAPVRYPLNFVGKTGSDGRLVVRFRGRRKRLELALLVESPDLERDRARGESPGSDYQRRGGVLSGLRRIEACADTVTRVALAPRSDDVLGLWLGSSEARGRRLAWRTAGRGWVRNPSEGWRQSRSQNLFWRSVAPSTRGEIVPLTAPMAQLDDEGWLTFISPAGIGGPELLARVRELEALGDFDAAERLELRQRRVNPQKGAELVRRRRAREEKLEEAAARPGPDRGPTPELAETTILVTVTREDGRLGVRAPVTVDTGGGWREPVFANSQGQCLLRSVTPGVVRLRAGGGDLGVAEQQLRLVAGAENYWITFLQREMELQGRLLDENGQPRAHWQVELELTSGATVHADTAIADALGRFAVPNLPHGFYRLLLRPPGPWGTFPLAVIDGVLPAVTEMEFRVALDPAHPQIAILEVAHTTGAKRTGVEARLWNEGLGRGVWITSKGEYGSLESIPLLPGPHEYVVGCAPRGWTRPRWFGISSFSRLGLGVLMLDEPGLLLLEEQSPEQSVPYVGLRLLETGDDVDVLVIDETLDVELPLLLPAGEYRLEYADGSYRELELHPGGTARFEASFLEWATEE